MTLTRPVALLLDYGGVLVEAAPPTAGQPDTVRADLLRRLSDLVDGAVPAADIDRDLTAGDAAYARWRDEDHPNELTHAELWQFVAGDWPSTARETVLGAATSLTNAWTVRPSWELRPGIVEALHAAADAGLPLAVVSNTACGAVHREFLDRAGVGELFAVQIYSDEAGVRKPNPEMIWAATRALDVRAEDCWFVGDSRQRDMVCARQAGAGGAVLMRSVRTVREDREPNWATRWPAPDATIEDGHGLVTLLAQAVS